jgi:hypothetical protein
MQYRENLKMKLDRWQRRHDHKPILCRTNVVRLHDEVWANRGSPFAQEFSIEFCRLFAQQRGSRPSMFAENRSDCHRVWERKAFVVNRANSKSRTEEFGQQPLKFTCIGCGDERIDEFKGSYRQ